MDTGKTPKSIVQPTLTRCVYNGSNFERWSYELKVILKFHKIEYVLYKTPPKKPSRFEGPESWKFYEEYETHATTAKCLMLSRIEPKFWDLYKDFSVSDSYQKL